LPLLRERQGALFEAVGARAESKVPAFLKKEEVFFFF
jgi:hypothetical protein